MARGRVKWFSEEDGYGFIVADDGEEVFVHYASVVTEGLKTLSEGQAVEFDLLTTPRGPEASPVRPVAAER